MSTSFLEIVELPDGRIELRRAEDEGSLVTLDFSEDAKAFLQGQHVEVAKAMLSVGVQMAGRLMDGELERDRAADVDHAQQVATDRRMGQDFGLGGKKEGDYMPWQGQSNAEGAGVGRAGGNCSPTRGGV